MNRRTTGDRAEVLACRYLKRHGLKLLTRNFHCRQGEIDLIMRDGDSLVFVEVRYRQRSCFGHAAETVTHAKQSRIIHCARYYMTVHQSWNMPARFDVVAMGGKLDDVTVEWFANAFQADG